MQHRRLLRWQRGLEIIRWRGCLWQRQCWWKWLAPGSIIGIIDIGSRSRRKRCEPQATLSWGTPWIWTRGYGTWNGGIAGIEARAGGLGPVVWTKVTPSRWCHCRIARREKITPKCILVEWSRVRKSPTRWWVWVRRPASRPEMRRIRPWRKRLRGRPGGIGHWRRHGRDRPKPGRCWDSATPPRGYRLRKVIIRINIRIGRMRTKRKLWGHLSMDRNCRERWARPLPRFTATVSRSCSRRLNNRGHRKIGEGVVIRVLEPNGFAIGCGDFYLWDSWLWGCS